MKNLLFYKKKAKYPEEALPVGNGRIGGLVFGNLKKERIALNEDSLWSGYPKDLNKKDAFKYLDKVRAAVFSGNIDEAEKTVNRDMHGHWSEAYLPLGNLIIEYSNAPKSNYRRSLDISKGIALTEAAGFRQTVFVSYPAQLMAVNIHCDYAVSFKVRLESPLKSNTESIEDSLVMTGQAPEICMPPYYNQETSVFQGSKGIKFCAAVKVIGNARFENDCIIVSDRQDTTLLISLATSYKDFQSMPTENAREKAFSYFKNIRPYHILLSEHKADFSALFSRVDFELEGGREDLPTDKRIKRMNKLGDDYSLIALLFQYGRYLTISASRSKTNAMTLQGIWNTHIRAPWSSSYTLNINTEMNYWCTDTVNLSECFEPLTQLVKKLAANGTVTAKDYYGCRGFCSHHNSDIWGATYPAGFPKGNGNSSQYAPWNMSAAWLLNQLYEHYLYTLDERFKKEITPLFESSLIFFKDFLIEKDGELVTCPSISPENNYSSNGKGHSLTYMPSMDREILLEFFENAKELGFDTPEITPLKTASDGRIPEWIEEYEETEIEHRHLSHLYCIYPSRLPFTDEIKNAAEKTLIKRGFGGTGWSLAWKICLWARLGNAENALKLIKKQLTFIKPSFNHTKKGGGTYPNLFDAHPPFQIDGNFGVTAGIAEMLKNEVLPREWSGHIKGIKTYANKEISYSFKNGKKTDAQ